MHGCGNDFIVVDEPVPIDAARARGLCDRRTGIGADGILVIGAPTGRRWPLTIHNADGSIADACGNGSRCVARYVLDRHGGDALELDTASGVVRAWRDPEGFAIELAAPQLGELIRVDGHEARTVRVGNPNVMVFVEDPRAKISSPSPPRQRPSPARRTVVRSRRAARARSCCGCMSAEWGRPSRAARARAPRSQWRSRGAM
ncbi:MAG TPA: hypothetical protein VF001_02270 [Candidatus Limnocylindria bacterium]